MKESKSRKGISPLIASVLLIAFTMAVAGMFSQWAPNLLQSIQQDTSQDAVDITRASNLGLEIMSVEFNRSNNQVEVVVQNTGEAINNRTNVSVGVIGGSVANTEQHNVDLSEKEITSISVPVDRTYPLETLQVSMTDYPVSDESGIKCTPTKGLVGYWTFNEEQTENGWAVDLSGNENNASIEGSVKTGMEGSVGESYSLKNSEGYIVIKNSRLNYNSDFTISVKFRTFDSGNQVLLDERDYNNKGVSINSWNTQKVKGNLLGESNLTILEGNTVISDGEFHQASVRNLKNKDNFSLWVDGGLESFEVQEVDAELDDYMGIGVNSKGTTDGIEDSSYWNGSVDELRLYNRSLSGSEINLLKNVRSEDWAVDSCKLTGGKG